MRGLELATCDRALPPAGEAPEWVHLLPPGKMQGRDGRAYELADPPGLILAFQSGGIDLPVDFEHQNDKPEARLSGPVPAAGWIKELRADETGLWGRVEWTATAREMIGRKEYRFLSPSFLHNKAGQIMRLKGAGLVHNPNLYLTALASQEDPMKPTPPKTTESASLADFIAALAALIGLPPETPPQDLLAALKAKFEGEPDPAKYMPVAAVQSMLAGRMDERLALSEERAEAKVDRAFKDGFLVTAMKPWALALCRSNEVAFDDYIAKSGPIFAHLLKPSQTTGTPPRAAASDAAASDLERAICEQLGLKPGTLIE